VRRLTRRAGKAGPAVAVAGALAAITPVAYSFASTTAPASAHQTAARPVSPSAAALVRERQRLLTEAAAHRLTAASRHGKHRAGSSPLARHDSHAKRIRHAARPASHPAASSVHLACSGSAAGGMLPDNYAAIVNFLTAHGYSDNGAAGIAGNIYQESKGDPESVGSGGGGLIGWTPLPGGFVTGNPAADLQTQLNALLGYNEQYAADIPALNAASTSAEAADIYMNDFERPGLPVAANREAAASAVAQACGF
jgi:hypothetical protein